ncbi:MAG: hypothetical protein ACR2O1_08115 [Boseongicola sp.]
MIKELKLSEIFELISTSAQADIENFLKISEISLGAPAEVETRLLETLSMTYTLQARNN